MTDLLHIYAALGEDALKRHSTLEKCTLRLKEQSGDSLDVEKFSAASINLDALHAALNDFPLFSDVRLVVIDEVESIGKDASQMLCSFMSDPLPSTYVFLSGTKLNKATKLYKALDALQTSLIVCDAPKEAEMARLATSMASALGATLQPAAASLLCDYLGSNTVRLDSEIKKLVAAHSGTGAISAEEVRILVAQSLDIKPWTFVDAFSEGNAAECLRLANLMAPGYSYGLLTLCVSRLRELLCAKECAQRGRSSSALIAAELKMPEWKARKIAAYASKYSLDQLKRALCEAADIEMRMKSGFDPDEAFLLWIVKTIKNAG